MKCIVFIGFVFAVTMPAFGQGAPGNPDHVQTIEASKGINTHRPVFQTSTRVPPHPAVVRVSVPQNDETSHGSGTLIDVKGKYGLVITNWHVVNGATGDILIVFPDGFQSTGRVVKTDRDWDLAAIAIWRPRVEPVRLAPNGSRRGDLLSIAGYGTGAYRTVTGRCTQYVSPGAGFPFEMVELSVSARDGDSGGPIFNARGQLAGVLFGTGSGLTSGTYSGRVGLFLASLVPDIRKPPKRDTQTAALRKLPRPLTSEEPMTEKLKPENWDAQSRIATAEPSVNENAVHENPVSSRPPNQIVENDTLLDLSPMSMLSPIEPSRTARMPSGSGRKQNAKAYHKLLENSHRQCTSQPCTSQDHPRTLQDDVSDHAAGENHAFQKTVTSNNAANSLDSFADGLNHFLKRGRTEEFGDSDKQAFVQPPPTVLSSRTPFSRSARRPSASDSAAADDEVITWQEIAGDTSSEQVKTILAAIGLLTLLFLGIRVFRIA